MGGGRCQNCEYDVLKTKWKRTWKMKWQLGFSGVYRDCIQEEIYVGFSK